MSMSMMTPGGTRYQLGAGREAQMKQRRIVAFLMEHGFATVHSPADKMGSMRYPLHEAVRQCDSAMVKLLLEAGASPLKKNSAGHTPEHMAIKRNWFGALNDVIQVLQDATMPPHLEHADISAKGMTQSASEATG